MIDFNSLRKKPIQEAIEETPQSERKNILNRGKREELKAKMAEQEDTIVEYETTSIIDILRTLNEDVAGRIVMVVEGNKTVETFVDFETAQYLLDVYDSLEDDKKIQFESTLVENLDNLDEIALYCESVIEAR